MPSLAFSLHMRRVSGHLHNFKLTILPVVQMAVGVVHILHGLNHLSMQLVHLQHSSCHHQKSAVSAACASCMRQQGISMATADWGMPKSDLRTK